MTEHTDRSEDALRAMRRALIVRGASVSLIAFDPDRGVYAFDELGDARRATCATCGDADHTTAEHAAPLDAIPTDLDEADR